MAPITRLIDKLISMGLASKYFYINNFLLEIYF